ncbi:MAG: MerR family transcriptional regulator [Actinophytocola sp.]|nr:MerR family transcriptional regulator [Actinophytocola sp.]
MRIGELGDTAGVALPTIKYYLREGLLPPGHRTSRNQAQYDDDHLRRLRLIRALIEVGGLPVAKVHDVLAAIDEPGLPVHKMLGAVSKGLCTPAEATHDPARTDARRQVEELIERHGWQVSDKTAEIDIVASVITRLAELGHPGFVTVLDAYFEACQRIAEADVDYVARLGKLEDVLEGVVLGTVFGEAALAAIRRLAHQSTSAKRFGPA